MVKSVLRQNLPPMRNRSAFLAKKSLADKVTREARLLTRNTRSSLFGFEIYHCSMITMWTA